SAPAEQLLRGQSVPACNRRNRIATLIALGDNPGLLLRRPRTPPTAPGKHLQPACRLSLRFGQKLCVRHVSNPSIKDQGRTFAHHTPMLKVWNKGRLRLLGPHLILDYREGNCEDTPCGLV